MDFEQTGLSTKLFLEIVRRRAPLILLCVILGAGLAYGYSKHKTKKYVASAALAFNSNSLDQQIAGLSTSGSSASNSLLTQQNSNLELVRLGGPAARTARLVGHGLTADEVGASISVATQTESGIITVSATSSSPRLAAAIANTYTRQFVKEQSASTRRFFKSALGLVEKQLAELSPAQRFGTDGLDLQERAHTLDLLAELGYNNVQVAQEALVPTSPSSPKTSRNTILGAIAGLALGFLIAFLLERIDPRIRSAEDLEAIYRLPVLGRIPKSAALTSSRGRVRSKGSALPPAEAEAFSLICAHLRFFKVGGEMRTLLITSAEAGDGKTTIARHLAEASARLGSRVLLLEIDLRHPTVARQFDLAAGPGLADVLIGDVGVSEATQSVDLQAYYGEGAAGRSLDVLAAGPVLPPNPGELLASTAMDYLLERVKPGYDLVVIDTPPLTLVSDALPLLVKVDGVVAVGRVRHSRRDTAERLQEVLAGSGAPLLGIVVNGSRAANPSYFADGKSRGAVQSVAEPAPSGGLLSTTKL
jgi:succinoglycan biosynthesis transport protein ExoP